MHRATPANTSFRAFSAGGARSVVDKVNDGALMQEMAGNFMKGETRDKIESPQNYGFSSVVLPAKKGKDGQIEESAEAFISFIGGNRSHPVATMMDDRRHRPMGLKPGENSQYDDIGQMTLMRRNGLYLVSLDSEDESQSQSSSGGATPTQQADGSSGNGKVVERMVSLRHVEKKKQERQKPKSESSNTGSGGSATPTIEQLAAEEKAAEAQQKKHEEFKHEGETVNTEIRCTKGRIEFRSGDSVVGYYDKGADTWFFKGKIVNIEGETTTVKSKKTSITGTERIETVGPTYLGLDSKDEDGPKVVTEGGPAKKVWAKV